METKKKPNEIFDEYKKGNDYKASIGDRGIADQAKMNERFYIGDQWHGVQAGNTRPLVRRNIIKRIGEYKISAVCAAPVSVNYSADGIPNTKEMQDKEKEFKGQLMTGEMPIAEVSNEEVNVIMEMLTAYNKATAERVKFGELANELTKSAYISGTAFLYTYWDETVETGLFADDDKTTAITGDINCEILNVVNVVLGDPNCKEIQKQPYIIVSQRKPLSEVKREAEANKKSTNDITADTESATYNAGDWGESEPEDNNRVTVLTKFWKEYDKETGKYRIKAIKVTEKTVIRDEWDLKIRLYPFAKYTWLPRFSSGYGDSEITYLIPNQIAINRSLSAAIWSSMITGMPKMVINSDLIDGMVTNDPGQIIKLAAGGDYDVQKAISYINPPQFAGQLQNIVADIANNTLSDMGANDAALGNIRPDNASAIIAMREAALQPMQMYQNTYYSCVEDIARIWADFWLNMYDKRPLKVENAEGTQYVPFDAERYKNLVVNARVDVGASTLWGESVVISTLSNLMQAGIVTPVQFLKRIPKGIIPDVTGLIDEMESQATQNAQTKEEIIAKFAQQYPEEYAQYEQMSESEKAQVLEQIGGLK